MYVPLFAHVTLALSLTHGYGAISLVLGDADGSVDQAFNRIATINKTKAGPFHVVFCIGSFLKTAVTEGGDTGELKPYIEGAKEGGHY